MVTERFVGRCSEQMQWDGVTPKKGGLPLAPFSRACHGVQRGVNHQGRLHLLAGTFPQFVVLCGGVPPACSCGPGRGIKAQEGCLWYWYWWYRVYAGVWVFQEEIVYIVCPPALGKRILVGESGTLVPLLTGAAFCPLVSLPCRQQTKLFAGCRRGRFPQTIPRT